MTIWEINKCPADEHLENSSSCARGSAVHDPSVERREFKRENVASQDMDRKLNVNEPVSKYCIITKFYWNICFLRKGILY